MNKISTFLWFENKAEDAVNFYSSLFGDCQIGSISYYGKDNHGKEGSVMTVSFTLFGQEFTAINGGPYLKLSPATSFLIRCEDQQEVDRYWEKLSDGGSDMQCGWVTDKFGVTWQIVPAILFDMLNDKDPQKAYRVTQAMLKMIKIEIKGLQKAYDDQN
jgi:predicted 3-demethylubiquinone-9 3-methyltransferase (glyoxalase superfamily)